MTSWLLLLTALVALALVWLAWRRGLDLGADFEQRRTDTLAQAAGPPPLVLTEALITPLPAPVQRYLRLSGVMDRPQPRSVVLRYEIELFSKPGAAGMRGPAVQIDRFDLPRRLFFMRTRMAGLPVAVLHDYGGALASMRVRVAALFDVVNLQGDALARTETVTLLNDLCFFAPAWLVDPRLAWTAIDDHHCAVSFTQGPHRVQAELAFNDAGELVNFHSVDRGALQKDGSLRLLPWSTPMRDYRDFDGRRVATRGEAIWTYPEGDFVYGRLEVTHIAFDAGS